MDIVTHISYNFVFFFVVVVVVMQLVNKLMNCH